MVEGKVKSLSYFRLNQQLKYRCCALEIQLQSFIIFPAERTSNRVLEHESNQHRVFHFASRRSGQSLEGRSAAARVAALACHEHPGFRYNQRPSTDSACPLLLFLSGPSNFEGLLVVMMSGCGRVRWAVSSTAHGPPSLCLRSLPSALRKDRSERKEDHLQESHRQSKVQHSKVHGEGMKSLSCFFFYCRFYISLSLLCLAAHRGSTN